MTVERPTSIRFDVSCSMHSVDLSITNTTDGRPGNLDRSGSGLAGMAERARVIGGAFAWTATNDHFTVNASLPHVASDTASATSTIGTDR